VHHVREDVDLRLMPSHKAPVHPDVGYRLERHDRLPDCRTFLWQELLLEELRDELWICLPLGALQHLPNEKSQHVGAPTAVPLDGFGIVTQHLCYQLPQPRFVGDLLQSALRDNLRRRATAAENLRKDLLATRLLMTSSA
jgi:hypothetical protein